MSRFVIPKGSTFSFTMEVKKQDSFDPQDLTNANSILFTVFDAETHTTIFTEVPIVVNAAFGVIQCEIADTKTNLLDVYEAPLADRNYLKFKYHASIEIGFSDATLPITAYIPEVYVSPLGV